MLKRTAKRLLGLALCFLCLVGWTAPRPLGSGTRAASLGSSTVGAGRGLPAIGNLEEAAVAKARTVLERVPITFIQNRGQLDPSVAFYTQGRGSAVFFTPGGVTFALAGTDDRRQGSGREARWTVRLEFLGANPSVRPIGEAATPTVVSYFRGPKSDWKTGLATYSRVAYRDLWPGIDLIYAGAVNQLKYEFVVKPGADPGRIRLAYHGASVRLAPGGQLEVKTPVGGFQDEAPYAYQDRGGPRLPVSAVYSLDTPETDTQRYGFTIGQYDRSKPLVIDPAVFAYAGYIGGNFVETAFGIAVDKAGNAYLAGYTESLLSDGFPATVGPSFQYRDKLGFQWTAWVAKVKADGTGLAYCGYIDGAGHQLASAIAVDDQGAAYVTGFTTSDQTSFPVLVGPKLTYAGGSDYAGDAFIAKVRPDGTGLVYCGYIGGQGEDAGYGIAVDSAGNAYVTGDTTSPGPGQPGATNPFPASVGPSLVNAGGGDDAFIVKVRADGTGFVYGGFIGGTGIDQGMGVAVDSGGSAYVTGLTFSSPSGFNTLTAGPSLTLGGGSDAFVAKLKPDGSGFVYCGYLGGASDDEGFGIAVDAAGNAYVTGETGSTEATFPVKGGPKLTYNGTDGLIGDAFVAKIRPDGTALIYCGYIGGAGGDAGYRIAVDASGSAYIAGSTNSSSATFPVTGASGSMATYHGGTVFGDGFVAKVDASGANLLFAGYIGGSDEDSAIGIAVDSSRSVYISGATYSNEFSFPVTVGPFLNYHPGPFAEADAFVAKIAGLPSPQPDFSIGFDQATITASAPSKVSINVNINRSGGFGGNVTITPPAPPGRGIKIPADPVQTTGNSAGFRLKLKGNAQSGNYALTFTGTDDSGSRVRMGTVNLIIQ